MAHYLFQALKLCFALAHSALGLFHRNSPAFFFFFFKCAALPFLMLIHCPNGRVNPWATNNLVVLGLQKTRLIFPRALTLGLYHFGHVYPFTRESSGIQGTQWEKEWSSERMGDDVLEQKLISKLSENALSPLQAALCLLNDLIITLLLFFADLDLLCLWPSTFNC